MTHKILIEPIFRITNWPTSIIKTNFLVQAKQFEVGLRFRNVGTEPTETFKITDIRIESAENKDLFHIFDNNFQIDTINPKSTREIWIDKFGTYLNGLAKIRIQILPKNDIDIFETYQKDKFTEILSKIPGHNEWIDFLYIQSQS